MAVVTRLFGSFTHNLDQQNRLAIPAKLRAELGDSFVLTISPSGERCLLAYTFEDWDDVMQKLSDQPASEELMLKQRYIYMDTVKADLDSHGRVTIPTQFMEKAGFQSEVLMLGVGSRMELWDPEEFRQMQERTRARIENQKIYFNK